MGKISILLGALLLAGGRAPARADDGYVQVVGGSASLYAGEHPEVRMDSETVTLSLRPDGYTVDASFEFFNHGESTTVAVGFPEIGTAGGPASIIAGYLQSLRPQNFETWVDGQSAQAVDTPGELFIGKKRSKFRSVEEWSAALAEKEALREDKSRETEEEDDDVSVRETRWLVKKVAFPAVRRTRVRVRYDAAYDGGHNSLDAVYVYGTGGSWNGSIGTMTYIVETSSTAWVREIDFHSEQAPRVARLAEFRCSYTLTDVKPQPKAEVRIAVGEAERYDFQPWEMGARDDTGDDWEYSSAPVPRELLDTLSRRQLRFLRNTFFARRGRVFQDPELKTYFEKRSVDRYGWYRPRADFEESRLDALEKENVRTIAAYEKRLN